MASLWAARPAKDRCWSMPNGGGWSRSPSMRSAAMFRCWPAPSIPRHAGSARRSSCCEQIGYRYFVLTPTFYIAVKAASEHLRLFGQAKEAAGEHGDGRLQHPAVYGLRFGRGDPVRDGQTRLDSLLQGEFGRLAVPEGAYSVAARTWDSPCWPATSRPAARPCLAGARGNRPRMRQLRSGNVLASVRRRHARRSDEVARLMDRWRSLRETCSCPAHAGWRGSSTPWRPWGSDRASPFRRSNRPMQNE